MGDSGSVETYLCETRAGSYEEETMTALIISTNYGIEQDELASPLKALRDANIPVTFAAPTTDPAITLDGDRKVGTAIPVDTALDTVNPNDYGLLVLPGGALNADALRTIPTAVNIVKAFVDSGKTIAAICHSPWLLAEANVLHGKQLTSWASIATDLKNAGATWLDQELVTCKANGWTLISSRSPKDLGAFDPAVVAAAR